MTSTGKLRFAILSLLLCFSGFSGWSQDNRPEKPEIVFVSIDSVSGETIIQWKKSTTPGIQNYNIYSVDTTTFPVTGTLLGTVPGDSLIYNYKPDDRHEIYTITAYKTGNESLLGGDYHRPAVLSAKYDSCSASMTLSWEPYIGWGSSIAGYRVYEKIDGEDFKMIYELHSSTMEIKVHDILENRKYEYIVEAFNNMDIRSTSNRIRYLTYMPAPPEFLMIDQVSVLDPSTIEITVTADISGEINDFQLTRAGSPTAGFTPVRTIHDMETTTFTVTDAAYAMGNNYFYKIEALNSCSLPVAYSNIGNNILLKESVATDPDNIHLQWNDYEGYAESLAAYRIYRVDHTGEHVLASENSPYNTEFSESLDFMKYQNVAGELYYYVEAVSNELNPMGNAGISRSNEFRVQLESEIDVPNAFNPLSETEVNRTFAPILSFTPREYRMFIYDRSGQVLFRTEDPFEGWDGRINGGGQATEGVYIYHIEYQSFNGVITAESGNLTLIRY